jgi:hypothetical protein
VVAAGQLDWWVKERQEWWGRVRAADGRQRWIRAVDLRPAAARSHDLSFSLVAGWAVSFEPDGHDGRALDLPAEYPGSVERRICLGSRSDFERRGPTLLKF